MKDLKYLLAYIVPVTAILGVIWAGMWSYAAIAIGFIALPLLEETIIPKSTENLTTTEEDSKNARVFFDLLLYLNLPLLFILLWLYFGQLSTGNLATYEIVGMTLSVGTIVSILGINVAHELGHRQTWYEQLMSKTMLLSALYMHFFIEHNRGHHKNVATDLDPASARYGEVVYTFWVRSVIWSYIDAWKLENQRLRKLGKSIISISNEMIWYHIIQIAYLVGIGLYFGWNVVPFAIAVAVMGFLLLESINYVEHYGLRRKKLPSGRYEVVQPIHSWNSNHEMGRIFLYELTRHSDHHFKASRKYQVLRHFDESPQLPCGYPMSVILALIPPLWFKIMNPRVEAIMATKA